MNPEQNTRTVPSQSARKPPRAVAATGARFLVPAAVTLLLALAYLMLVVPPAGAYTQRASRVKVKISNRTPLQDTTVTVWARVFDQKGRVVKNAHVTFVWRFAGGARSGTARTDATGWAKSRRNIGTCESGRQVTVSIRAVAGGNTVRASTAFTPRSPDATGG